MYRSRSIVLFKNTHAAWIDLPRKLSAKRWRSIATGAYTDAQACVKSSPYAWGGCCTGRNSGMTFSKRCWMTYGLDTTFLVQLGVAEHSDHDTAVVLRDKLIADGHDFALAPQVISEYLHIVTDPRRFESPAVMADALEQTRLWWNAAQMRQVRPEDSAVVIFHDWMAKHSLGRRRILDTLLAVTYRCAGITAIISSNARDYRPFFKTVLTP